MSVYIRHHKSHKSSHQRVERIIRVMGTSTSNLEDIVGMDEFGGSSMARVRCCPDGSDLGGIAPRRWSRT